MDFARLTRTSDETVVLAVTGTRTTQA